MRFTHPGMSEAALCAHFEYLCCLDGAQRLAYVPVVASGYVPFHGMFTVPMLKLFVARML